MYSYFGYIKLFSKCYYDVIEKKKKFFCRITSFIIKLLELFFFISTSKQFANQKLRYDKIGPQTNQARLTI